MDIPNVAEEARKYLAAPGMAGLPAVEKDNVLPPGEPHGFGSQMAPPDDAENQRLTLSYQSGLVILAKAGVRHIMQSPNRALPVLKQWATIVKVLSVVTLFNYVTGTEEDTSSESGLFAANTIPSYIWFVACLLTGASPTTTVFKKIIEKWEAIKEMLKAHEIDDVDGTAMIMYPLQDHARGAAQKYVWLLRMDSQTRFNKPRLDGITMWMDALHTDTKKFMRNWLAKKDAEVDRLIAQAQQSKASHDEAEIDDDDEAKSFV
jgi:hypothetical protein